MPVKELKQEPAALPPGTKYAWVQLDDSLSLSEAKDIIKKLDIAFAKSTTSAKVAIASLKEQLQESEARIQKLELRFSRKKEEVGKLKIDLTDLQSKNVDLNASRTLSFLPSRIGDEIQVSLQ